MEVPIVMEVVLGIMQALVDTITGRFWFDSISGGRLLQKKKSIAIAINFFLFKYLFYYIHRRGPRLSSCILENCAEEVEALKKWKTAEREEFDKKCNPDMKSFEDLEDEERQKMKDCFREIRSDRTNDSTEFQNLRTCADEKCPNEFQMRKMFEKACDSSTNEETSEHGTNKDE